MFFVDLENYPMTNENSADIILVEDDSSVADFLVKGLTEVGYSVSVAFSGYQALEMIQNNRYDLIILDIMLPDRNGLEICKDIRAQGLHTPVLFLTALGTADNIAIGLNTGEDDCIVKPFKFIELNARVNALLRRSKQSGETESKQNEVYTIHDLQLDHDSKSVYRAGREVVLTATEYRLLLALMRNKNRVMSRMDLLEAAWDLDFNVGTNVVDVYINYLRKKVDVDFDPKLIQTVIGMGYVIKDK